jgi:anti-sigma factor RsiW
MADEPANSQAEDLACVAVVEIVADYLEGTLPPDEERRLRHHLDTCPGCAEYLKQLRTVAGSLRGVTEDSFPAEMRERLVADFSDLRKP